MAARLVAGLCVLLALAPARADEAKRAPACVLLIRHAEKPADGEHLNAEGKQRAAALPKLFGPLPKPDFVFAAKDSKKSHRCTETVAPLAKKLGLKVDDRFANEDYAKLAKELRERKYAGKTVLICWHHGNLPELAGKLGLKEPPDWKGGTFDRLWLLDHDLKGKVTLHDLPQRLLPGDAKK